MHLRTIFVIGAGLALIAFGQLSSLAAEKVRYSITIKSSASFVVPVVTAEQKGFWRRQGLEVEWIGFRSGSDVGRAVVARQVSMGSANAISTVVMVSNGVPMVFVAALNIYPEFSIWVRSESPFKKPTDLQGAKVGINSLHDLTAAYGRSLKKELGLEVKLIGTGGSLEKIAALKSGTIDAIVASPTGALMKLKVEGAIREVLAFNSFLPSPLDEHFVYARKDYLQSHPGEVKKVAKAMLEARRYIRENPSWAMQIMKTELGFSGKAAELIFKDTFEPVGTQGKIDARVITNALNFLVEYGLVDKNKAPSVREMYTTEFVE